MVELTCLKHNETGDDCICTACPRHAASLPPPAGYAPIGLAVAILTASGGDALADAVIDII